MNLSEENITLMNDFSQLFFDNRETLKGSSSDILNKLRNEAFEQFKTSGFPEKKNESYKYTYLLPHLKNGYKKYFTPSPITFNISDIFHCDIPELDTHVVVLLNGFYYTQGEKLNTIEGKAIVGSLSEAAKQYPELVEKYYGKSADFKKESLVALNSAFAQDGVFVYIPKGVALQKPIQIVNILLSMEDLMVQHRNLFILEENSEANLVICDHSLSPQHFLTNSVNEVFVGNNARFDMIRTQNEHNSSKQITHTYIQQEAGSVATSINLCLHGGLIRNNLHVTLGGERSEANVYGLYLADGTQHVDNFTYIEHLHPNCNSNQLYKGILDNSATGAFNGRIYVHHEAQKTNAYQRNNTILLSSDAHAYTKPQLEIYADDVKCSHGATVGQLDENSLFYLRSRGISYNEARLLLLYAFAHEIIGKIHEIPLQERMDELIDKRLRGELSRCNNCAMHCKE